MIVADASALVLAVADTTERSRRARLAMASGVTTPHLADAEVGQTLRNLVLRRRLEAPEARRSLDEARRFVTRRVAHGPLMARAWALRDNVTFYDALHVALAEARGLTLVTADAQLAGATGPRCRIDVV